MKVLIGVIGACAAILTAPGGALAQSSTVSLTGDGLRQTTASFADLNINTHEGAATLVRRIRAAAERVCGPSPSSPLELGALQRFDACMRRSMDEAVGRLRATQVSLAYSAGTG